jgi:adenosylcobinamide-phosphate synthase
LLVAVGGVVLGKSFGATMDVVKRFAQNSDSPNSGYPEAAFAGALGVRLGGGKCVYFGDTVDMPPIGDGKSVLTPKDLFSAVSLSKITTFFALIIAVVIALL